MRLDIEILDAAVVAATAFGVLQVYTGTIDLSANQQVALVLLLGVYAGKDAFAQAFRMIKSKENF